MASLPCDSLSPHFLHDAATIRSRWGRARRGYRLCIGSSPLVKVYDGDDGAWRSDVVPYETTFTGGVQVAVGDVNGDGTPDIIAAPGPGREPTVKVFSGADLSLIASFNAYASTFTDGVFVAAADFNADGRADIVTAPIANGDALVKVFSGADLTGSTVLFQFSPYATTMTKGVRIAVGDVNADGTPDIIAARGKDVQPYVRVFDGSDRSQIHEFLAFDSTFMGGVFVAAGDVTGDGQADIIAGAGPGGGPAIRVFDGSTGLQTGNTLFVYDMSFSGGVRVAAVDVDNDDRADILTSPGNGIAAQVKAYDGDDLTDGTPTVLYQYTAYGTFTGGAFVGGNGGNWAETLYSWDHRNRLTAVTEGDANGRTTKEVEYTYDVFDRRIAKDVDDDGDGTVDRGERYVYDGEDIALVFDGAGSLENRYLHGPGIDEVFADENALGEILWALGDNQGTVRDWARSDGTIANHVTYNAFGEITGQTSSTHEPLYAYTGREWDADAAMYYYRARWYDPDVGRWVSEDPMGLGAGDANLSRYVGNSPSNYTDPTGHFAVGDAILSAMPQVLDAAVRGLSEMASDLGNIASFIAGAFCSPSGTSERVRFLSPAEVADAQQIFAIPDDQLDTWLAQNGFARDPHIEKLLLSGPRDPLVKELLAQQQPPPGGVYYPVPRYRNHQIVGGIGGELSGGGGSDHAALESPTLAAVSAFFESIWNTFKSVANGEAGRALGDRWVAISENRSGDVFDGDASDWGRFFFDGTLGDFSGVNPGVEAVSGYDMATWSELSTTDRIVRGAGAVAAVAGNTAGALALASRASAVFPLATRLANSPVLRATPAAVSEIAGVTVARTGAYGSIEILVGLPDSPIGTFIVDAGPGITEGFATSITAAAQQAMYRTFAP